MEKRRLALSRHARARWPPRQGGRLLSKGVEKGSSQWQQKKMKHKTHLNRLRRLFAGGGGRRAAAATLAACRETVATPGGSRWLPITAGGGSGGQAAPRPARCAGPPACRHSWARIEAAGAGGAGSRRCRGGAPRVGHSAGGRRGREGARRCRGSEGVAEAPALRAGPPGPA